MDTKVNADIKSYADRFLSALERIAAALEKQARSTAYSPTVITGHEIAAVNLTPAELKSGNEFFPGTDKIAAAMNAAVPIPYESVRIAILAYSDAKGATAAEAVLKRFGAKYIKDLKADPTQYQAVLDSLK
jgi:hypothetical protein